VRSFTHYLCFVVSLGLVSILTGCGGGPTQQTTLPQWNQYHGDSANMGQTVMATLPAKADGMFSGHIGQIEFTSPVFAPDGSILYSISGKGGGALTGIFRMTASGSVAVGNNASWESEQLSTSAVDDNGWIYTSRLIQKGVNSELLMTPPGLHGGFELPINGTVLAPPKVYKVIGGPLIFVPYVLNDGYHLQIWNNLNPPESENKQPKLLVDKYVCGGAEQGDYGFHVRGFDLPAPYPEAPAVAIRMIKNNHDRDLYDPELYVVVASDKCGITFYSMKLAYTPTDAPTLTEIKTVDTHAFLSTPAISEEGIVVINDSDKRTTAYDVKTGDEKWHFDNDSFVLSTPTFPPLNTQFVYIQSYTKLTKIDLVAGPSQPVAAVPTAGQSDSSPAIGGQFIFVSTVAGLTTFNLDLSQVAFTPLAGGESSPAINTATGQVVVATTDGQMFVFKGP
jgi:outer membrane protein assembly factor BamB